MITERYFFCLLLILWLVCANAFADSAVPDITNFDEIAKNLKLKRFEGMQFTHHVKVAILDNGFAGYEAEVGKKIPATTVFHVGAASDADKIPMVSYHGLFLAELMSGIIAKAIPKADYELHLFYTFGYTKFADAVDTVIKDRYDVVLYAQVWEFGGNGDSKGFINAVVNKAVDAHILWINSAGNYGHAMRTAPVEGREDAGENWEVFKDDKGQTSNGVKVICATAGDDCNLRLVLAWNRFSDDPEAGTDTDLDLFLYDSEGKLVASSEKKQRLTLDPTDPEVTKLPREVIEKPIKSGVYTARVKIKSTNFDQAKDRLRLTVFGENISIENPTIGETLLPPADNSGVIDIGASDDLDTSTSKQMKRPDIWLKSMVQLANKNSKDMSLAHGSSPAAAEAAALTVLECGIGLGPSREQILGGLRTVSEPPAAPPIQTVQTEPPKTEPGKTEKPSTTTPPPPPAPGGADHGSEKAPAETGSQTSPPSSPPASNPPVGGEWPESVPSHLCYEHASVPSADRSTAAEWLSEGGHAIIDDNGRAAIEIPMEMMDHLRIPPHERAFITPSGMTYVDSHRILGQGVPENYIEVFVGDRPLCASEGS